MLSEEAQLAMGKVGQMPVLQSLVGQRRPARLLPDVHGAAQDGQGAHARCRRGRRSTRPSSNAVLKALRGDATVQAALDEAAATVDGLLGLAN